MKVGETQEVKTAVAKSETDQLTVGKIRLSVCLDSVCLICGGRETGMEVLSA